MLITYAPERLARQVAFLDEHPDVGICSTWMQEFGSSSILAKRPLKDEPVTGWFAFRRAARLWCVHGADVRAGGTRDPS